VESPPPLAAHGPRGLLQPLADTIEAVGVAMPRTRLAEAAALATACGANRMCPLERMQAPPFAWRQSGHARVASLMTPERPATMDTRPSDAVPPPRDARRADSPREHRPPLSGRAAQLVP
jgi:hypothetical protein